MLVLLSTLIWGSTARVKTSDRYQGNGDTKVTHGALGEALRQQALVGKRCAGSDGEQGNKGNQEINQEPGIEVQTSQSNGGHCSYGAHEKGEQQPHANAKLLPQQATDPYRWPLE